MTVLVQQDGHKIWFWINKDSEDIYCSPDNWSMYWKLPRNWTIASIDVQCPSDCPECDPGLMF